MVFDCPFFTNSVSAGQDAERVPPPVRPYEITWPHRACALGRSTRI